MVHSPEDLSRRVDPPKRNIANLNQPKGNVTVTHRIAYIPKRRLARGPGFAIPVQERVPVP